MQPVEAMQERRSDPSLHDGSVDHKIVEGQFVAPKVPSELNPGAEEASNNQPIDKHEKMELDCASKDPEEKSPEQASSFPVHTIISF